LDVRVWVLAEVVALTMGCRFNVSGVPAPAGDLLDLAFATSEQDQAASPPSDLAAAVDTMALPPVLEGKFAAPNGATNLTTLGTVDWAHWGLTSASDFNHRSGGQIPNFTKIGNAQPTQYTNYMWGFSWTNGTPRATADNTLTGVYQGGVGSGFMLSVPADTTTRIFRIFVANYANTSRLTAHLSDGSAPDFTDELVDNATGSYRTYTLRYRSASAALLTVTWQATAGLGTSTLQAATLSVE
jgi:hypothetical protein